MLFKKKLPDENILKNIYKKERLVRYSYLIVGLFIVACAFNIFILPGKIVYGMNGVGVVFKNTVGIDPSLVIMVGNVILLMLSFLFLGKEKTTSSIVGSLMMPILIKITSSVPTFVDINYDPLLFTLFGSILTGFGLGLVFKGGFTTGGTDILNQIVSKFGKMSIGSAMIWTDGLIIVSSVFAFGWTQVMYSLIALYIISIITDKVILGISSSKAFYIITDHETAVKKFIMTHLSHGVTVLDGRGGFTGNHQKVIMCIIPTKEYFLAKEGIRSIDPNAFFLVTDAYEVYGGE